MTKQQLAFLVLWELDQAEKKHPDFPSAHHGISVIRAEYEELWEHVKADSGHTIKAAREAVQIAATAMRYVLNLTEMRYANEEREISEDDQRKHQGVSPRPDLCKDGGEARQENSRSTSDCGGGIDSATFTSQETCDFRNKLLRLGFTPKEADYIFIK